MLFTLLNPTHGKKWIMLIVLVASLFAMSCEANTGYDWDWMDCHHGTYYSWNGTRYCMCDQGWGGVDCSLCTTNDVCPSKSFCDQSLVFGDYTALNCTIEPTFLIDQGSLSGIFSVPDSRVKGSSGVGVVTVYRKETGAPFLFNCTVTGCTKTIDLDSHTEKISCDHTSCYCSSWCSEGLKGIVTNLHGQIFYTCDTNSGECQLLPTDVKFPINFKCTAAACATSPYNPPPNRWTKPVLISLYSGLSFVLVLLVAAFIVIIVMLRRSRKYQIPPMHKRDFRATMSFHNISCTITNPHTHRVRKVLNGVSGVAHSGQILAIVGPSGSGKTTFIDILAGRKNTGRIEGEILINGKPRTSSYKRISGYVLQEDKMLGTLTVREHLMYIAQLKLPSDLTYHQKEERVEETLRVLGIDHIANSMIGTEMSRGISGGERRRLSIASELVTDPAVLLLDEPTSGLDSYTSFTLIQTLKRVALDHHRTIVISIHQPRSNIFRLFDQLLLLSHGEMVYFGAAQRALEHFALLGHESPAHYNPADFLIDLVTMNSAGVVRSLSRSYRESETAHQVQSELENIKEEQYYQHRSEILSNIHQTHEEINNNINQNNNNNNTSTSITIVGHSSGNVGHSPLMMSATTHHNKSSHSPSLSPSHRPSSQITVPIGSDGNHDGTNASYYIDKEKNKEYASSWIQQVYQLSHRTWINNMRNPYLLKLQYSMILTIGLLLGIIYWHVSDDLPGVQNRAGSLFFMVSLLSFGSMSSLDIFFHERPLFVRERANGMYCTSAYFVAKAICDIIPMRLVPPLILGSVSYYMIGLNTELSAFLYFLLILVLVSLSASSLCLAISSCSPSLSLANLVAILLLLFYMLFGGFLVNKTHIPVYVRWLKWLSFLNYGFEVLMVNELIDLTIRIHYDTGEVLVSGRYVLSTFDMDPNRFWLDLGALSAIISTFMLFSYLSLRFLIKEKR